MPTFIKNRLFLALIALWPSISFAEDNLIVYPISVGKVTAQTSEAQLEQIYGKANVRREIRPWGDAGYSCATILFSDSEKELEIFWKDESFDYSASGSAEELKKCETSPVARRVPSAVQISGGGEPPKKGSYWKTKSGVHVGMSLFELEKLNGAPINFESSSSCFDGGILDWHGGKLEKEKETFSYSRISYPLDGTESFKQLKSSSISSKDLPQSLKKQIYLGGIEFSLPAEEKEESAN